MTPMLRLVARAHAENYTPDELARLCFVFPNKRSATFFLRYLDLEMAQPHIEPEVMTIADFAANLSPLAEAPRFLQLATLYDTYREIIGEEMVPDFDRFLYWGETLLADFADVDRYLADPKRIFTNIEELKEINSTYLTETQREIIERYWGADAAGLNSSIYDEDTDHAQRFWTHVGGDDTERTASKFIRLWQILLPLYQHFNAKLAAEGYATSSQIYRHAAEALTSNSVDNLALGADRYVFVGFNMLSTAEIVIFTELMKEDRADFYWDVASPAFAIEGNRTGETALRGARLFPSRLDIGEEPFTSFPEIEIKGVASRVGQAKVAAGILDDWQRRGYIGAEADESTGTDTAVVLADENLLMPMLGCIPSALETVNVTMGFPMRQTPIASVMRGAIALQRRMRRVNGSPAFFYEDVVRIISQPAVRIIAPAEADALLAEITDKRRFTLDAADTAARFPSLAPLFRPIMRDEEGSLDVAVEYFADLINLFAAYATEETRPVERAFLLAYRAALDELADAFRQRSIVMRETTMAALIERALASATVSFTGEPLAGVQIMGVLETRSLDFDNIIMMSMNETKFPARRSRPSFIPESLRRAFGLPGKDFAEHVYGYYFYRLLTRARRVALLYDARSVGNDRVPEISRYLSQILYLCPGAKVRNTSAVFSSLSVPPARTLTVEKTPEIMEKLLKYTIPNSGKNLSASSLNTYINCPMQFYLKNIEGLDFPSDTDGEDYVDWSTYGTIVHEVAEKLYKNLVKEKGTDEVTPADLRAIAENRPIISRMVTAAINRNYLKLCGKNDPDVLDSLRGETEVLGGIIVELISRMFKLESESLGTFRFIGGETKLDGQIEINPDLKVNIRQVIDRLDTAGPGGILRIVDYKTGKDERIFDSIASAFDPSNDKRPKVLFQLMFYCYCYSLMKGYDEPIQPYVYLFKKLFTEKLDPPEMKDPNKKGARLAIVDYHAYLPEFKELLNSLVESIFDPDIPFEAAINDPAYNGHKCKFCSFGAICNPPRHD